MIVVITVAKSNGSKSDTFGFIVIVTVATKKVNERRTIYEKLIGNGSVMDNYAECDRSCNSHNLG